MGACCQEITWGDEPRLCLEGILAWHAVTAYVHNVSCQKLRVLPQDAPYAQATLMHHAVLHTPHLL